MLTDFSEIINGDSGSTPPSIPEGYEDSPYAFVVSDDETPTGEEKPEGGQPDEPEPQPDAEGEEIVDDAEDESAADEKPDAQTSDEDQKQDDTADKSDELTDEQIDEAISDGKKRKRSWWQNAISHKNKRLAETADALAKTNTEIERFRALGDVEELARASALAAKLYGFTEENGELRSTTRDFARELVSQNTDKAIEVLDELVNAPNPAKPDETLFDRLVELPEVQEYLKNKLGFSAESAPAQTSDDPFIADNVAAELREVYKAMPEALKNVYKFASDEERAAILDREKIVFDQNQAKAKAEAETKQNADREIHQAIETRTAANLSQVGDQFAESLKSIPFAADASQNRFLQHAVMDRVFTAVTLADKPAGKAAAADLKEIGVEIAPETGAMLNRLSELSAAAERRERQATTHKDAAARKLAADAYKETIEEIGRLQLKLAGASNEIAGKISAYFGRNAAAQAAAADQNLLNRPTPRPTVSAGGSTDGKNTQQRDYSKLSYAEIMALED
jgi:hypothetical protein